MTTADDPTRRRERRQQHWQRRRRLERRLHDGAALRISSLALRLGVLDAPREQVAALQDEVASALDELRTVAADIYPPLLHEAGLGPALTEHVRATGADVVLDVAADRGDPAAEGALYFALVDVLAVSGPVAVRVHRDPDALVVLVAWADPADAEVLAGLVLDEAAPLGGDVRIAAEGISGRFPCG